MTATTTPIRECDAALDYLYDMLSGDDKARFEAHLATCARCQQELAAFGKVRAVARATLPKVEPTDRLAGPLHAQLMHAAAQRPPRGKVLPFLRRVLTHPAYAAAAGILIVGGAIGVQWSRGKLLMPVPAPEASAPVTASPAEQAPAATPGAVPLPEPAAVAPEPKGGEGQLALEAQKNIEDKARARAPAPAKRPVEAPKEEAVVGGAKAREERAKAEAREDDGARAVTARLAKKDSASGLGSLEGDGAGSLRDASRATQAKPSSAPSSGPGLAQPTPRPEPAPKSKVAVAPPQRQAAAPAASAPAPASPPAVARPSKPAPPPPPADAKAGRADDLDRRFAERSTATADESAARGYKNAAPGAPPTGAAAADDYAAQGNALGAAAKSTPVESETRRQAEAPAQRGGNASNQDTVDGERNRAALLAQKGRCEEAVHAYESLERRAPDRVSATDRLTYARCLRELGRLDPAQRTLDQLRAAKQGALPAAALNAEQKALDERRKRQAAADAASTGETQQQTPRHGVRTNKKAVRSQDAYDAEPSAPASNDVKRAY